jgi:hypothetical protein
MVLNGKIYHHWLFPPTVLGLYLLMLYIVTIAVVTSGGEEPAQACGVATATPAHVAESEAGLAPAHAPR